MIEFEQSQAKARILMEALPYVRRFRGSIFVVKYGGSFMDSPDPEVRSGVAKDLVFLNFVGIKVVVVHGEEKLSPGNYKSVESKHNSWMG